MKFPHRCITLEEHAILPALGDERSFTTEIWKTFPSVRHALQDLDTERIADMDAGHVSVQVISALPGMSSVNPTKCAAANDELAEAIKAHPNRFGGFAALPMQFPDQAAVELERAVRELGLCGAMIDNHLADGTHHDDSKFWAVFETAERLDVPVYIHPAPASDAMMEERFQGNFATVIATGLSTGAWGWHENVGLHVLKLYAAGLFEKFPKLKIIIGHMGEMLPMMLDRIDRLKFFKKGGLSNFTDVWKANIWVTTSGIFSVRTLEMLLKVTAIERVMYSVDSPFEKSETGWKFMEEVARSGLLSEEEMNLFSYGNAEKLLHLE